MKRLHLSRWFEYLFPAPFDFGLPELVPASEVEQIIARAKVRECRTDLPDLVTDDDLLALVYASGVPFADRTVVHEPSAVERGWAA